MIEIEFNNTKTRATIVLNRKDKSNAMNTAWIKKFSEVLDQVSSVSSVKICIIQSAAKHFCVGADIAWMQASLDLSVEDNMKDVALLANLFNKLYRLPAITIAAVHGAVFGGGLGLLACCDFVIADQDANFCFSEIKLGLMPATIAPYVAQKMSLQVMRRLMLSAEAFQAQQAYSWGLVDEVTEHLNDTITSWINRFLPRSKQALLEGKQMFAELSGINEVFSAQATSRLARMRQSADGQEGLKAFLEKRLPIWKDDV